MAREGDDGATRDFAAIALRGRRVELVPDGDVRTNPAVARGVARFAEALELKGAAVRQRLLPLAPGPVAA